MIPRSLTVSESLRPDDIAHAVSREQDSSGQLLLGVSGDVAANHGQAHTETQPLEKAQPKTDQACPLVSVRETDEHSSTGNANEVGDNHCGAARVWPLATNKATSEQSRELNEATRNLQVLRAQCAKAESLDDQGCELEYRVRMVAT